MVNDERRITNDFQTIALLGRQPALGTAELESLFGAEKVKPYGSHGCFLSVDVEDVAFNQLGGSMRLARVLTKLPDTNWRTVESYLLEIAPERAEAIDGKLSFGISVFGLSVSPRQVAKTALAVKKAVKAAGHSVRMVPHDKTELSSATVLYNKLTSTNGWELLVVSDGKSCYLAQTYRIQDIDAYAARDQARPYRDAKVGMLPPKLAQIIINLAVGHEKYEVRRTKNEENLLPRTSYLVLDPFCGTGVVLQEAMLMNYDIYGTDLEPRMVQYTIDNLSWLDTKYPEHGDYRRVEIGDAASHVWQLSKIDDRKSKIVVAGETYLGQPLTSLPNGEHLSKIIYDVNLLHHKFLENIGKQLPSGTRLCLAIPTWRGKHEFLHLPMLDYIEDLGYTRSKFEHVSNQDLIYHREGQVVGRELLVLIKN
jgi:tRNA G10  N-methylase Trm11